MYAQVVVIDLCGSGVPIFVHGSVYVRFTAITSYQYRFSVFGFMMVMCLLVYNGVVHIGFRYNSSFV